MNITEVIDYVNWKKQLIQGMHRNIKFYDIYCWEQEEKGKKSLSLDELEDELKDKEIKYDKLINKLKEIYIDVED